MSTNIHQANIADYRILAAATDFLDAFVKVSGVELSEQSKETLAEMNDFFGGMKRVAASTGEERVCATFDHFALGFPEGFLPDAFADSVVELRREVRLPCGVIDRLLILKDGSAVAVELKAPGSRRDHAGGLGQVLVYTAALRESGEFPNVDMMLVCGGNKDPWIGAACKSAGVQCLTIPHVLSDMVADYGNAARLQ